jgi:hypothetical protein
MAKKKTSGGDSPLRQGVGKSFWTLLILGRRRRRIAMCFWKIDWVFRFSHRGVFIGEGAASGVDQGSLTHRGHGPGAGRAALWCGWPVAPHRPLFGLHEASVKIGGSAFVSSNSENISCVTFLKHKNSKKQETDTMASY